MTATSSPDPGAGAPPRVPRWLVISGIIVGILVLVAVGAMFLVGGGDHGPGQHTPGGDQPPAEHGGDHNPVGHGRP